MGAVSFVQAKHFQNPIKMKIYKDVFSGDELFSDTYPIKVVDDVLYEVTGKHITRSQGEIQLEGSNASAEGGDDEGTESTSEPGVDIILNHRSTETRFGSKKDYMVYLKDYMKKVVKHLEDNDRAGEVDTFKTKINGVMKDLLGRSKDLQFFTGESMDADAMILILDYKEVDGEEKPILMAFKHGICEEKY